MASRPLPRLPSHSTWRPSPLSSQRPISVASASSASTTFSEGARELTDEDDQDEMGGEDPPSPPLPAAEEAAADAAVTERSPMIRSTPARAEVHRRRYDLRDVVISINSDDAEESSGSRWNWNASTAPPSYWTRSRHVVPPPIILRHEPEPEPKLPAVQVQSTNLQSRSPHGTLHTNGSLHTKPKKLGEKSWSSILFNTGDILVVLTPVAFIVLAALTAYLNGQEKAGNGLGYNVSQALELGPTLFPIVFAAVAGKTMKSIARYAAEKGTKLGTLELLMASQTVWGAFESQVLLKTWSLVSVHLLMLWILSPLGSQASFRILGSAQGAMATAANLLYLPTGGMVMDQTYSSAVFSAQATSLLAGTNAIYNAILLAPGKDAPQDTWGNLKIPWISDLDTSTADPDGWMPTLNGTGSSNNFTSLVGLPVAGRAVVGSSNYEVEYAHLELACPQIWNVSKSKPWWREQLGQVWGVDSTTDEMFYSQEDQQTSFFLDTNTPYGNRISSLWDDNDGPPFTNRNILYGSESFGTYSGYDIVLRNCTAELKYVEAMVACEDAACKVTHLRDSVQYAKRDSALTPLDLSDITGNLFLDLPAATGNLQEGEAAPTELFIRGSDAPLSMVVATGGGSSAVGSNTGNADVPTLLDVSNELFARRLGIILNTYYNIALAPSAFTGQLLAPPTRGSWGPFANGSAASGPLSAGPFYGLATNATMMTPRPETYKVAWLWFALLMGASVVLLVVGVGGLILKSICHAPDMMGYVASMTYDNEYVRAPRAGTLDGMDRARALKHMKVRIGDVWGPGEVGHIAFSNDLNSITGLSKDRLYV